MEKSASELLVDAADLLQEEGMWIKSSYFRKGNTSKGCMMCAHGAIAYCSDRNIREDLAEKGASEAAINNATTNASTNSGFKEACKAVEQHYGAAEKARALEAIQNNPRGWAHYAANRNGLTIGFNDAGSTTKADVINKLREAAEQARAEGK